MNGLFAAHFYGHGFGPEVIYKLHTDGMPDEEIFEHAYSEEVPEIVTAMLKGKNE